ncbi:MAG: hypothetical protein KF745_09245 [Phycisphaeraceae bacterium]|nr:hypothetical protein [Phycisphaeraceae bacterium]
MSDSPAPRLRVLFVTEDDPLYVIRFFEVFFAEFPRDRFEIIGITIDAAFHESKIKTARRILRFYGPAGFARMLARFAAAKLSGRSIGSLARCTGIPMLDMAPSSSVNDAAYIERVRSMKPDVIVSVAAPEIFRKDILASARLGCVNIHSGRLPKYRGMMPNFWQMLHGESHATVTVHEMVPKLDAGAVLGTLEFAIRERDTLDRVITETKREGARLMIRVLSQIQDGAATRTPVNMDGVGYFSFPKPEDVRRLRERGHRLI